MSRQSVCSETSVSDAAARYATSSGQVPFRRKETELETGLVTARKHTTDLCRAWSQRQDKVERLMRRLYTVPEDMYDSDGVDESDSLSDLRRAERFLSHRSDKSKADCWRSISGGGMNSCRLSSRPHTPRHHISGSATLHKPESNEGVLAKTKESLKVEKERGVQQQTERLSHVASERDVGVFHSPLQCCQKADDKSVRRLAKSTGTDDPKSWAKAWTNFTSLLNQSAEGLQSSLVPSARVCPSCEERQIEISEKCQLVQGFSSSFVSSVFDWSECWHKEHKLQNLHMQVTSCLPSTPHRGEKRTDPMSEFLQTSIREDMGAPLREEVTSNGQDGDTKSSPAARSSSRRMDEFDMDEVAWMLAIGESPVGLEFTTTRTRSTIDSPRGRFDRSRAQFSAPSGTDEQEAKTLGHNLEILSPSPITEALPHFQAWQHHGGVGNITLCL